MLSRLKSLWRTRRAPQIRRATPSGALLYAIGDVHGRSDLLEPLLADIRHEAESRERTIVTALGDYVDRGPDSRGVVDLLLELSMAPDIETHFLRGNHDQFLLDFLSNPSFGPDWCRLGGRQTLFSYGVEPPATRKHMEEWIHAREAFASNLPARHLQFFKDLNPSFTWGDYFFVHAGARPGRSLESQSEQDLMSIRKSFLADESRFEKIVVHGHTPAENAYADYRRIGLDTGAFYTGVLSACRFLDEERLLIQAVETPGGSPQVRIRPL